MLRAQDIVRYFSDLGIRIDLSNLAIDIAAELNNIKPYNYKNLITNNLDLYKKDKICIGNIKARARMIALYDIANKHNGLVLSTDNLTELLLGFWTLHGDVGDLGFIQGLFKTEVYGLSNWILDNFDKCIGLDKNSEQTYKTLDECIKAVPTDGLGITESDYDQLECDSYSMIDYILIDYLNNPEASKYKNHPVVKRYEATHFKRENPYNFDRTCIIEKN